MNSGYRSIPPRTVSRGYRRGNSGPRAVNVAATRIWHRSGDRLRGPCQRASSAFGPGLVERPGDPPVPRFGGPWSVDDRPGGRPERRSRPGNPDKRHISGWSQEGAEPQNDANLISEVTPACRSRGMEESSPVTAANAGVTKTASARTGWRPARNRAGVGVTALLVALVMLPVMAIFGLAGSVVLSRSSASTQAGAVYRGVGVLSKLVALQAGLRTQQAVEEFEVRFAEVGASTARGIAFIGVNVTAEIPGARAQAAQAIASLGRASPVDASALRPLYASIDAGRTSPAEAAVQLKTFGDETGRAITSRLNQLEGEAPGANLVADLESVRSAVALVDVATPQGIDLSSILLPSPRATPQSSAAVLARFGEESAQYAVAASRIRQLGVKGVVANLDAVNRDPQVRLFDQAAAAALAGQAVPLGPARQPGAGAKVAQAARGYLIRDKLLAGLVPSAAGAVSDEARRIAASERTAFLAWVAAAAAIALASIGVALRLAQSISRPLKDLASHAHAINEGELDADPPPRRKRGPRETRVAFAVFGDLVTNLRLLDAKANALAHCDFENPVLGDPLPGRLGRSLESSAALLSGSIVERDQLHTNLAHQATHDSLTGLGNRPAAVTAIQAAVRRTARTTAATAVLLIDLKEFKLVNESHGHEVGDEVLRQVGARLNTDLRGGDFVARLGGDEFVVVAEGVANVAEASDLARRLIDAIGDPIVIGEQLILIAAAVGVAMTFDATEGPLKLLAGADAAMQRARRHETSAVEIFGADLQNEMIVRADIETALAAALADPTGGGLRLHYQPVLDSASSGLVGVEALIRWDRAGHGRLAPDSFIPIAEATSLIVDLDCWVLNEATRQLAEWSVSADLAGIPVAVNISGRHLLSCKLPGHIRDVLDRTGIDPHLLSIEITETVLLNDLASAANELETVRSFGVGVAIDDYGTGYTSLSHLQRLPVDTIKIDRSFVSQLSAGDPLEARRGNSLVRMVTEVGHAMEAKIVAEGVENDHEMSALQTIGADHLQGYLFSFPLEPQALASWIAHRTRADERSERVT